MCPEAPLSETKTSPDQALPGRSSIIYGLLDLAGTILAVNALHIREATPYPEKISPMATQFPGLLGAMILREDTIPLIDLGCLLRLDRSSPQSQKVVIVISHKDRLLGLVVDALHGMTEVQGNDTTKMDVVGIDGLTAGARNFVYEDSVVGILEPETIFEMVGLPFSHRTSLEVSEESADTKSQAAYLLCSYNDHYIAFSVGDVQATIPMTPLDESPIVYGYCDGVVHHHGRDIPVIDTMKLLGLGANFSRPERSASVALRMRDGAFLALEIDRFYDIVHCSDEAIMPLPPLITTRNDLLRGVLRANDARHYMVVDSQSFRDDTDLSNLARSTISERTEKEINAKKSQSISRDQYLVFRAAGRMACRLTDIVEIIRLPDQMLYADVRFDGFMGTLSHRNQLVPILSIANMLGEYPFYEEQKASVLLFRCGSQLLGMVIENLEAVERCSPAPEADLIQVLKTKEFLSLFDITQAVPGWGCDAA